MIQKVLLSTINYDHPQNGMLQAFRSIFGSQNVQDYDYLELKRHRQSDSVINQELISVVQKTQPDWIWFQLQETGIIKPDTIEKLKQASPKTIISIWNGDCRARLSPYVEGTVRACHLALISNVGQISLFREAGAPNVRYCQVGMDFVEDIQGLPPWIPNFRVPEVVFCANYYGSNFPGSAARLAGVQALRNAGIDIGVVGKGWPVGSAVVGRCGVKQQFSVYQKAKVALSINNFNDVELFYSDRHLSAMASGIPLVTRYVPGLEEEFENGQHCLWYKDEAELIKYVQTLLEDEALRKKIGFQGRAEVIRKHTWFSRILDVIPTIELLSSQQS